MAGTAVMDIHGEIQTLIARSRELSRDDMAAINRIRWQDLTSKRNAMDHVERAHGTLTAHLGEVETTFISGAADEADMALVEAELAAVAVPLDRRVAAHMRMGVLDGFRSGHQDRRSQLADLREIDSAAERTLALSGWAKKARSAARFFTALADNPQVFTEFAVLVAADFRANHLRRAAGVIKDFAPKLNLVGLGRFKALADAAGKLFLVAQVGLATVSIVFATAADTANWATVVAKSTVAAGAPISLGVVAGDKFVQREVWSHLKSTANRFRSAAAEEGLEGAAEEGVGEAVAVGVAEEGGEVAVVAADVAILGVGEAAEAAAAAAIEAPPVAVVLACAGLAMFAAAAVVSAFDFCMDWIFGAAHLPRTMYVPAAAVMAVSTTAPMS